MRPHTTPTIAGLLAVLVCAAPLSADGEAGTSPPSSADVEALTCLDALARSEADVDELAGRVVCRAPQVTDGCRKQIAEEVVRRFAAGVLADVPSHQRLFDPGNALAYRRLLEILGACGRKLAPADALALIPSPTRDDAYSYEALSADALADFVSRCKPDTGFTDKALAAMARNSDHVDRFLILLRLGWAPANAKGREQLSECLDRTYFKTGKPLPETRIAQVHRLVGEACWRATSLRGLRDHVEDSLAQHLFDQPVVRGAADRSLLRPEEYLDLAGRYKKWIDWAVKMTTQLKTGRPNDRAMVLLDRLVALAPHPLDALKGVVGDDVGFYVELHGQALGPRPWVTMIQTWPDDWPKSVAMLKAYFDTRNQAKWTIGLLDVLAEIYYPLDSGSYGLKRDVLLPIARGTDIPAGHLVRRALLSRVQEGSFPPDWPTRWELAWAAAEPLRLKDPLPVGPREPAAVQFLGTVCRHIEPRAADDVKQVHGRLLAHVWDRLFVRTPPDAALDDEMVVNELILLFQYLAASRSAHPDESAGVAAIALDFWNKTTEQFEKVASPPDRPRMIRILRLMFRICAVLGDDEPVNYLAEHVGKKIFNVTAETPFRCLADDERRQQAGLLVEIHSAIREAVQNVRRLPDVTDAAVDQIVDKFLERLYVPLLRTDRFAAEAGSSGVNPWLELLDLYGRAGGESAARTALMDELHSLPLINSPVQVQQIAGRWCRAEGIDPWSRCDAVRLSANVNLTVLKGLLDDTAAASLPRLSDGCPQVLGVFLSRLADGDAWTISCQYDADGRPIRPVRHDRWGLLSWLTGVLTFHEACTAPFRTGFSDSFRPWEDKTFSYTPSQGPRFGLDPQVRWTRRGVDGSLRLTLCDLFWDHVRRKHSVSPGRAAGAAATDDLIELAELLMFLPNRPAHTAVDDQEHLELYASRKSEMIQTLLTQVQSDGDAVRRYRMLRAVLRLQYALGPVPTEPLAQYRDAREKLGENAEGAPLYRALAYEEVFLRMANSDGDADDDPLRTRVDLLLQMLQSESAQLTGADPTALDAYGMNVMLQHHAAYAEKFLQRVGPQDVVTFSLVMDGLAHAPMSDPANRRCAAKALYAFALAMPYYGLGTESLGPPRQSLDAADANRPLAPSRLSQPCPLDALILFCQLHGRAKMKIIDALRLTEPDSPQADTDRLLAALLQDHNCTSVALAGTVWENADLLRMTLQQRPYVAETADFRILYSWRTTFELNARELFGGAIQSCQATGELLRLQGPLDADRGAMEFLFSGLSFGRRGKGTRANLDQVLRVCARVQGDARYEHDADPNVRRAAESFKSQAERFCKSPPSLDWFDDTDRPAFQSPLTYLRVCEMAGRRIEQGQWPSWDTPDGNAASAARWERLARDTHAALWRGLLFKPVARDANDSRTTVRWSRPFVRSFCQYTDSNTAQVVPRSLDLQRELMLQMVRGESSPPEGWPQELGYAGLKATLDALDQAARRGDERLEAYLRAYWQAAQQVLGDSQIGRGLSDGELPYLARPFLQNPGGPARAITPEQFDATVAGSPDGLFEELDWPNRWDDLCGDRYDLRDLIGKPVSQALGAGRPKPGLAGEKELANPADYRQAAWESMGLYLLQRLRDPLARLDEASVSMQSAPAAATQTPQDQARPASLCEAARNADRLRDAVVRDVLECVVRRRQHNRDIQKLAERSVGLAGDAPTAGREEHWRWFSADDITFQSARRQVAARGSWRYLAPEWAPFAKFAGLESSEEVFEPGAIGVDARALKSGGAEGGDFARFAAVSLLGMLDVPNDRSQSARLAAGAREAFGKTVASIPDELRKDLGVAESPAACADAIAGWTGLNTWGGELLDERQTVCRAGRYRVEAIPYEQVKRAREKLSGLGRQLVDDCAWRRAPSADWVRRYQEKWQLLAAIRELLAARPAGPNASPALARLEQLTCRSEPLPCPFGPLWDASAGRVILAEARDDVLTPGRIRELPAPQRQRQLRALRAMCLVPREVVASAPSADPNDGPGRLRAIQAAYMGYVDLLDEFAAEDANSPDGKERP